MGALVLDHIGLSLPRRFERTLVFLWAVLLALVVAVAALHFALGGELSRGSPRARYFVYLAVVLALALACTRWPRVATTLLCLATLETGFGFGSALLYKFRLTTSETLFPRDYVRPPYGWHPLLQALPLPTPPEQAADARVFINSQRMRGRERTPDELKARSVIGLFGGSTTLDFISPEGKSWADQLERLLGPDRFAVINHGVTGYTTAEHVLQTAFYQDSFGVPPNCAVYYIGWNDLRNAHIEDLDPAYANYHQRQLIDALDVRRAVNPSISFSPTLSLLGRLAVLAFDTARPAGPPRGKFGGGPDPAFEAIYRTNIATISAINRQRGIRTIWVGQVMNNQKLTGDGSSGWLPFVRDREIPAMLDRLNAIVKQEAHALGDIYIDVPPDDFGPSDFGDEGHFNPAGSLRFAERLAPTVRTACAR